MSNDIVKRNFLIYSDENGEVKVNVMLINNDLWLTQELIAELFGKARNTITGHIKNIFEEGELEEKSNVEKIDIAGSDKPVKIYNLNVIIAVGYRVNSKKATQFRIWATKVLKEYITKGFVLDDERLKKVENIFGQDYFKELLERIRSIRTSERRIWQQVTDIFAECSIDYDKNSEITQKFYATVQNKFHYAITGNTAAEIIYDRANSEKDNMGLTTWKHSPNGRILKSDVMIAKNYLDEKQIKRLERTVAGYKEDYYDKMSTQKQKELDNLINANKIVIVNKGISKFNDNTLAHGGRTLNDEKIHFYPDVRKFKSDEEIIENCKRILPHECFHYFIQPDKMKFKNQLEEQKASFYTEGLVEKEARIFCERHKDEISFKKANYGYNINFVNMIQEKLNASSYDIIFSEDEYLKNIGKYTGEYSEIIKRMNKVLRVVEEIKKDFPSNLQNRFANKMKTVILQDGNTDSVVSKLKEFKFIPKCSIERLNEEEELEL